MRADYLKDLRQRYANAESAATPDPLAALLSRYREYRATGVLDSAIAATQLSVDQLRGDHVDPLVAKAIHATNPGYDPYAFHSADELAGVLNSAKGKYFEFLVAEKLNHGERVGDVLLPDGYRVDLAHSMTQPGWDMKIVDAHGHVDEYLQLKATESTSYIHHALATYPDIKILATSEAAARLGDSHMVLDASMSEDQIRTAVEAGVGGDFIDHFWDSFHPVIPLLIIATMQGCQVAVGRRSVRDAVELAVARGHRAVVTTGVGALVKAIGGGWLAIPAAVLAGIWVTEMQTVESLVNEMRRQNRKLALLGAHYTELGRA